MPKLNYTGSDGVVQLKGTDEFLISGTGLMTDVEEITTDAGAVNLANATALKSYGLSRIKTDGGAAKHVKVPNPSSVSADLPLYAGMQKIVYVTENAGQETVVVNDASAELDTLTAAGDYLMLVWTGSKWLKSASKVTA